MSPNLKAGLFLWLFGSGLFIALVLLMQGIDRVFADPGQAPPAQPALSSQPNPDVYTCCGLGAIDYLNAAQDAMLRTGVVRWHYAVEPGCEGLGSIKGIIEEAHQLYTDEMGVQFVDTGTGPDEEASVFNCGAAWKALCPGAVGCLAHSWPYKGRVDYDGPTLLSYAFRVSQVAVVLHEECHHVLTCDEQYNKAAFSCIPGWHDFMNCGPDSRHYFETVEKERVKRIAYPPALTQTGYDFNGAWHVWACGLDSVRAKRLSVLVDQHDGRGIVWTGVYPALAPDRNNCQGVGPTEGLTITPGYDYFIKQESVVSAYKWWNETCVKGSLRCR